MHTFALVGGKKEMSLKPTSGFGGREENSDKLKCFSEQLWKISFLEIVSAVHRYCIPASQFNRLLTWHLSVKTKPAPGCEFALLKYCLKSHLHSLKRTEADCLLTEQEKSPWIPDR